MKKKTLIWLLIIATVLIVALLWAHSAGVIGSKTNGKAVEVTTIEPIDIVETVAATGKIQPEIEVNLS